MSSDTGAVLDRSNCGMYLTKRLRCSTNATLVLRLALAISRMCQAIVDFYSFPRAETFKDDHMPTLRLPFTPFFLGPPSKEERAAVEASTPM